MTDQANQELVQSIWDVVKKDSLASSQIGRPAAYTVTAITQLIAEAHKGYDELTIMGFVAELEKFPNTGIPKHAVRDYARLFLMGMRNGQLPEGEVQGDAELTITELTKFVQRHRKVSYAKAAAMVDVFVVHHPLHQADVDRAVEEAEDKALKYAYKFLDIFKQSPDQMGYVLKNLDGEHYRKHKNTKITLRAAAAPPHNPTTVTGGRE